MKLLRILSPAVVAALLVSPVQANELRAQSLARGLVIHDAAETLDRYCVTDAQGRLWFELPGGARFELITNTSDPAVSNPGDGSFHPFESLEVETALTELAFPSGSVAADVFLLPYPRRSGLESAAGPGLILLSPGVRPISRNQQHAEFVHELGHVVQYALLPDSDATEWSRYRTMRGIEDGDVFSAGSIHANRPHEIFAEDFRALFGGSSATYSGTIENPDLEAPAQVPGLREFLLELVDAVPVAGRIAATPNPARGAVRFTQRGGAAVPLDLFDAAGRRVATLEPSTGQGGVEWRWDARDAQGRALGRTVIFARVRGAAGGAYRVALID